MTTLHDDPFDSARLRKEADADRRAAEARVAAQEEARKRTARQHLEDEKRQLTQKRDETKRKLEKIQQEIEEAKRTRKKEELVAATERQTTMERVGELHDEKEKRLLGERLTQIQRDLARLAAPRHALEPVSSPAQREAQAIARKLSIAQAALEKSTLEHAHVTHEIASLTRMLEQKRAQEEQHRREKTEAVIAFKEAEAESRTSEATASHEKEHLEKQRSEAAHAEREKERLQKEQTEVEDKLAKLGERANQHGREKRHHDEGRRKAEEEITREGNVIRDLERRMGILSRDLQAVEEDLRSVERKLSQL
jgi:chromosome segregation ATPase